MNSLQEYVLLSIAESSAITNLDFLSNLDTVDDTLIIALNPNLIDFCGLNNAVDQNGITGTYTVVDNAYNPTLQDLVDGNCT